MDAAEDKALSYPDENHVWTKNQLVIEGSVIKFEFINVG